MSEPIREQIAEWLKALEGPKCPFTEDCPENEDGVIQVCPVCITDRIINLLRAGGWVKLAEDQILPSDNVNSVPYWETGLYNVYRQAQKDLVEVGWRKVELEERK